MSRIRECAVEYNWEASAQPARSFFMRTIMSTKEVYEFCVLCGPETDAPLDNTQWVEVMCRSCAYNESHGWEHTDEMVNPENYH